LSKNGVIEISKTATPICMGTSVPILERIAELAWRSSLRLSVLWCSNMLYVLPVPKWYCQICFEW
jgi:hypothetical protein